MEEKRFSTNAKGDAPLFTNRVEKNFCGREDATRNTSCPRKGSRMREWGGVPRDVWEGRDCNGGFQWRQKSVEKGYEGTISSGPQGGCPGNNDEEVMVHIIL